MSDKLLGSQHVLTINHRPLSWLEHAEKHYKNGTRVFGPAWINTSDEILMYLCIMTNEGMFD